MSTWKNKLDSLTVEYLKDLTRKDITKIAPGDTTQIDSAAVRDNIVPKDTTLKPVIPRHDILTAGQDSINTQFNKVKKGFQARIDSLDKQLAGFNKMKDFNFDVSGSISKVNSKKQEAIDAMNKSEISKRMAKKLLESKIFGSTNQASDFMKSDTITTEQIRSLALEMDVSPKLVKEVLESLPPTRSKQGKAKQKKTRQIFGLGNQGRAY